MDLKCKSSFDVRDNFWAILCVRTCLHGGATSSPGRISKAREKRPGDEVDGGGYPR